MVNSLQALLGNKHAFKALFRAEYFGEPSWLAIVDHELRFAGHWEL